MSASIQALVKSGSPKVAYFKADARARYKYVRDALEGVQAAGLEKVAFLVEQQKTSSHQRWQHWFFVSISEQNKISTIFI